MVVRAGFIQRTIGVLSAVLLTQPMKADPIAYPPMLGAGTYAWDR